MKKYTILFLLPVLAACSDQSPDLSEKVNLASIMQQLQDAYRVLDPSVTIDSISILSVDTVRESNV